MHNPHIADIPMNREVTYFARTNFRGGNQIFGIKKKDRRQHLYILGKSGTGKSALISNQVIQDIWNGEGLCLVDPHGELVETVLKVIPEHRLQDVVYFNPSDTDFCIGFNPLEIGDPKYKHLVASGLMGIFTKIWANVWSARMEYIMNNTILALLDTPNSTLLGITRMLVDKDYRKIIVDNLKDPIVRSFWVHEYEQWKEQFRNEAISPIQNKVGQFLSSSVVRNIVGQQESTIDIFKLMNEGKIFLVNVSKGRIGENNSALLGAMIITKLQLAAMERVRIPEEERRDFYLYVDEFQNFATDSFASILSEARKYRLCLTLAHQYTAQIESKDGSDLKDAVFGNVGSMIIFRIGADDAKILEKEFAPEFIPEDFVGLPNYQIYLKLMIDGVTSRPFSANTLPPVRINDNDDSTEKVIEMSRKLYSRPRQAVEERIEKWSNTSNESIASNKNNGSKNTDNSNMHPATCVNCNKEVMVPFKPQEGKPVYCKECLNKVKNGEIKPIKPNYDKIKKDEVKINQNNKTTETKIQNHMDLIPVNNDSDDKEGFTSLKDFLKNIDEPKKEIHKVANKTDAKTVTLNKIITDKNKTNNTNNTNNSNTKPLTINPKAATTESQKKLSDIIGQIKNNSPFTDHHSNKEDQYKKPIQEIKRNESNNTNKDNIDTEMEIPKPPASYLKNKPNKEVPEDVLKKLFENQDLKED